VDVGRAVVEVQRTMIEAVPASFGVFPKTVEEVGRFANGSL
jgi:hypothetical protein